MITHRSWLGISNRECLIESDTRQAPYLTTFNATTNNTLTTAHFASTATRIEQVVDTSRLCPKLSLPCSNPGHTFATALVSALSLTTVVY